MLFNQNQFTEYASEALARSFVIAPLYNSGEVGSEHILVAVLSVRGCKASQIFYQYNTDAKLAQDIEIVTERLREVKNVSPLQFSARAKSVLSTAKDIAINLGHSVVSTEHIMTALMQITGTTGYRYLLHCFGRNFVEARQAVQSVIVEISNATKESARETGECVA